MRDNSKTMPRRPPRWGTRSEGMAHGKFGSTTMNDLMQSGHITAKKAGKKVLVDLNSIDDYILSLPDVTPRPKTAKGA
jgi:hypothetical protein